MRGRLAQSAINGATTEFLHDGDNLVAEYDGSNNLLRRYVHGPGIDNPLVWFEGSAGAASNASYLVADRQGSTSARVFRTAVGAANLDAGDYKVSGPSSGPGRSSL